MRPTKVTVASATSSTWVPINELANNFQIGLAVAISSGASLTYNVQHTFDETGSEGLRDISISRTTTTATVTDTAHGLTAGDNVLVEQSGSTNLDGSYVVASVTNANVYTYTVANSGATAALAKAHNFRVYPHAILTLQTTRLDGNYGYQIQAVRLNISTWVSGTADLTILQGMGR